MSSLTRQSAQQGWTLYDWAVSAFQTSVVTVFIGPYLTALAQSQAINDRVFFGPIAMDPTSFVAYMIAASILIQAILLPILGVYSDQAGLRSKLLWLTTLLGSMLVILFFMISAPLWWLGGILFALANIAFGAAEVFYNAYLPDIARPDERDRLSSQAYALGYLGGGLFLAMNLVIFQFKNQIGLTTDWAVRLNISLAGLWCLGWGVMALKRLTVSSRPASRRLQKVGAQPALLSGLYDRLAQLKKRPQTLRFLIAYLFYNDGVQTVITIASIFATIELQIPQSTLIQVILMIQFVAFFGAHIVYRISQVVGSKPTLIVLLLIWIATTYFVYAHVTTVWQFWITGGVIACILGGTQALSRSLFAQLIPSGQEAAYFSFFLLATRGTSWMGPLLFGLINQIFNNMRIAVLTIGILFVIGCIGLLRFDLATGITEQRRENA